MDKMVLDALNRGWDLGFATGRVQSVRRPAFDWPLAQKNARMVQGSDPAPAAGFRSIAITAGVVAILCSADRFWSCAILRRVRLHGAGNMNVARKATDDNQRRNRDEDRL